MGCGSSTMITAKSYGNAVERSSSYERRVKGTVADVQKFWFDWFLNPIADLKIENVCSSRGQTDAEAKDFGLNATRTCYRMDGKYLKPNLVEKVFKVEASDNAEGTKAQVVIAYTVVPHPTFPTFGIQVTLTQQTPWQSYPSTEDEVAIKYECTVSTESMFKGKIETGLSEYMEQCRDSVAVAYNATQQGTEYPKPNFENVGLAPPTKAECTPTPEVAKAAKEERKRMAAERRAAAKEERERKKKEKYARMDAAEAARKARPKRYKPCLKGCPECERLCDAGKNPFTQAYDLDKHSEVCAAYMGA